MGVADLEVALQHARDEKQRLVREHAEEWKNLPWLAALADGRTGWSGKYQTAYTSLRWPLRTGEMSAYEHAAIDLRDPRIVSNGDEMNDAPILIDRVQPESLDVEGTLELMAKLAREEVGSYYDAEELRVKQHQTLLRLHKSGVEMPELAAEVVYEAFPAFPEMDPQPHEPQELVPEKLEF